MISRCLFLVVRLVFQTYLAISVILFRRICLKILIEDSNTITVKEAREVVGGCVFGNVSAQFIENIDQSIAHPQARLFLQRLLCLFLLPIEQIHANIQCFCGYQNHCYINILIQTFVNSMSAYTIYTSDTYIKYHW
jgi:hypothetical protein